MVKVINKALIIVVVLASCLAQPFYLVNAQTGEQKAAAREALEQELREIEQQIKEYEQQLTVIKGEKNTLQNKIRQLRAKQAALNLQIQATNLKISDLEKKITVTLDDIAQHESLITELRQQLSEYIRLMYQRDNFPFYYTFILGGKLSDMMVDLEAYVQVSEGLQVLMKELKVTKQQLESQAAVLAEQQDDNKNLLSLTLLQQQTLVSSVNEQNTLLNKTKGRESEYQKEITVSKQRVAEIRGRIYQLLGVSQNITFGAAVDIATWVSQQTGVRAAFLLAVLTQESNLGKNVGTCNRPGDPPAKGWRVIMKPTRDHEPWLAITKELGMNPDETPVSCPMRNKDGSQLGWGGAMGPAQFIPSTWQGYKARVSAFTGHSPANPWDIRDAFVAAGIMLKANGADGTRDGEWKAAMRYFSGGTNPAYSFYGNSVLELADGYADDIAALGK
ncbi:MAG: Peptidase, M23 family domain protein [Parcubacteria group bacterium GW2011_GWD2_43_10]|uniref:Transglycosylase SLT domain-containing protein n=2 Tax=Candidatus Vebleniibacteriota TaxID=1817921 RepID=A0A1G2Q496_9BACT|nr:MAG: Peptidase, M23 family domain protein [Parcubacteria group bacterium GW2011_GWD2_43_10]KKT11778.1 MAG: Peptidase, M23 family domain protein [Parcubacteria group bacterium GW2011_GWA1_43_27]OHA54661.1 MAG: hypothetical protein A2226_01945 [Candidatus Veblenbacteria bacterium RIFOXYA2_FULL_43_9]OHA56945.1 MAG: hypothetical protein A2441_01805 [Candidatus Veblenbacteria bacterium RIFOXYC2_FULL_42_11]HBT92176.1 hypothetical protein [Candidatus Veblenbacteria bacterium]